MENITKIGKPGDIFINRAGQECVWVASDGIEHLKYRFRLLSEHEMREQEIAYINLCERKLNRTIDKRIYEGEISIWGMGYVYKTGDWYVRFDGSSMACNKWEEPLDIVKKKEE